MHFYVIGVDKYDPSSDKINVKLRVYTQKPDPKAKENPNGVNGGEMTIVVPDAERAIWQDRAGKFADASTLQFK